MARSRWPGLTPQMGTPAAKRSGISAEHVPRAAAAVGQAGDVEPIIVDWIIGERRSTMVITSSSGAFDPSVGRSAGHRGRRPAVWLRPARLSMLTLTWAVLFEPASPPPCRNTMNGRSVAGSVTAAGGTYRRPGRTTAPLVLRSEKSTKSAHVGCAGTVDYARHGHNDNRQDQAGSMVSRNGRALSP